MKIHPQTIVATASGFNTWFSKSAYCCRTLLIWKINAGKRCVLSAYLRILVGAIAANISGFGIDSANCATCTLLDVVSCNGIRWLLLFWFASTRLPAADSYPPGSIPSPGSAIFIAGTKPKQSSCNALHGCVDAASQRTPVCRPRTWFFKWVSLKTFA